MNNYNRLFLSHLLTCWVDRSFEFASFLMISKAFSESLLQSSVFGLITTLIALTLSNRIGNWINIFSRIATFRFTLLAQKSSIIISTILFHFLDASQGPRYVLYAINIILGCTLKLAFIGNSIAIEKDWANIISNGHLEELLPTMRRIDLVCKTLSPILIGYLLLAPTWIITIVICSWTTASSAIEYLLISKIHQDIPALNTRTLYNTNYSSPPEEEHIEATSIPRESREQGGSTSTVSVSALEYLSHKTFLATLSLGILYINVLSFGGIMSSYLVLIGYSSGILGIMKALAGIMGVAGTYIIPLISKRIGNIRAGLWSIWQFAFTLALVLVGLSGSVNHTIASVLVFGGMAVSRIGLWMFDIAENLILQEYTEPIHITSIAGWQYSMCNLFDLLQYILTIAVSDPSMFIIPASISVGMIVAAAIIYTWFTWSIRGHLLHELKLK